MQTNSEGSVISFNQKYTIIAIKIFFALEKPTGGQSILSCLTLKSLPDDLSWLKIGLLLPLFFP